MLLSGVWSHPHKGGSDERQKLLLEAEGLRGKTLVPKLAGTQNQRIKITLQIQGPLEQLLQFGGRERKARGLVHGLTG